MSNEYLDIDQWLRTLNDDDREQASADPGQYLFARFRERAESWDTDHPLNLIALKDRTRCYLRDQNQTQERLARQLLERPRRALLHMFSNAHRGWYRISNSSRRNWVIIHLFLLAQDFTAYDLLSL